MDTFVRPLIHSDGVFRQFLFFVYDELVCGGGSDVDPGPNISGE